MSMRHLLVVTLCAAVASAAAAEPPADGTAAGPGAPRAKAFGAALGPFGHEGALGTVSPWNRGAKKLQVAAGGGFYTGSELLVAGASDRLADGAAAISFGVNEWLSLAATFSGRGLDHSSRLGNVIAVGEVSLGALGGMRYGPFAAGGFVDVRSLPKLEAFGSAGVAFAAGLALGAEVQGSGTTPLRATLNAAFHRENVASYGAEPWDDVNRLGYRAYARPRLEASALLEWGTPYVSPLVELRSHLLLGAPGGADTSPLFLTPGVRVSPTDRIRIDLSGILGFNAGVVPDGPATLPWMGRVAISYELEPFRTVEVVREIAPRVRVGSIRGVALDARTGEPLGAAIVALPSTQRTDLATHPRSGAFDAAGLEPGLYPIVVQKDGYEPEQAIVTVRTGEQTEVKLTLKPQPPVARFKGFVRDEKGNPLAATLLLVDGPVPVQPREAAGTFEVELQPGRYRVEARSLGYLAQGRQIEVRERETVLYDFVLREVPATRVAVLSKSEIKINQVIEFEFNKARILPTSYFILDEVVDVLLQNAGIARLEIAGHTDNVGGAEPNLKLSQERAGSVRDYLVEKGIAPARLSAKGYGLTKPVAPNDSEAGRSKNRRVEFLIRPN